MSLEHFGQGEHEFIAGSAGAPDYRAAMPEVADRERAKKAVGRLEGAISRLLTKSATVQEARTVADGFRLLTMSGDALKNVSWIPGQKVQLMLGGWTQRTYTPLSWDAANGATKLLAYIHGASPASDWAATLSGGEPCAIFGPRGSLDLTALGRPSVLFGDETSFGLAHALRHTSDGARGVHLLLEVSTPHAARAALDSIDVSAAELIPRQPADAHLAEVERRVTRLLESERPRNWVLTGKASSIARLSKRLRQLGVPRRQIQAKAYWAPGKVGLD
jgi:ferric-chelate reductase (NADPH)